MSRGEVERKNSRMLNLEEIDLMLIRDEVIDGETWAAGSSYAVGGIGGWAGEEGVGMRRGSTTDEGPVSTLPLNEVFKLTSLETTSIASSYSSLVGD